MGRLTDKGSRILKSQYYDRTASRNEIKIKSNGRMAQYQTITSSNSLKQHTSQWKQFAQWAEAKNIASLKKVDGKLISEYLNQELERGMAEKTLKSRVTAINHVMIGSNVWNAQQAVSLKEMRLNGHISSFKGSKDVYKDLTAKEFRERKISLYKRNKELIDFSRAFGLRRSEIFGKPGSEYEGITYRNLGHIEGSDKLFAEVIGKGGKYRIAPVREDMRACMWELYGRDSRAYQRDYFQKPIEERKKILQTSNTKAKNRIFSQNKQQVPLHISRNEYVEQQLKERQTFWEAKKGVGVMTKDKIAGNSIGYRRISFSYDAKTHRTRLFSIDHKNGVKNVKEVKPFSIVKIGNWQGYAIAAADVMRAVGHNRLDVLRNYL